MTPVEEEWFVCTYVAAGMQGMEGGGAWRGGGAYAPALPHSTYFFVVSD
jgi:hypothetical protein